MKFVKYVVAFVAAVSCANTPAFAAPVDLAPRAAGQNSITFTATQDLFNEAVKVAVPVAKAVATGVSIPDQSVSRSIPLLGDREIIAAKNIRIETMDITQFDLPLDEGRLRFEVNDAAIKVTTDVSVLGAGIGKTEIFITAGIGGSIVIRNNGAGGLVADVQDVSSSISRFDFNLPVPVAGDVVEAANRLFSEQIRGLLSGIIAQPVDDAITRVLNTMLEKQLEVNSAVQGVQFGFKGEVVGEPQINANGLTASVAIIGSVSA
ncbi:hypothetical protein HK102_014128 [Quaeritorhiza haematococci]|nr:hypothetical protein HK102_014128 [Quaeritorhiza haematococci]